MPFSKLKKIVLISALVFANPPAFANEGGGEGEGGKPAAAAVSKDEKEFTEKTAKLNSLTNRIAEAEKRFAELVHEKSATKSTEEKQKIIAQMLEVAKQRNKDAEEYNKVKMDLQLRYPNQGERLERRYQTQSKRTVEELEGVAGLDELLTRVKKVVEKKFASFEDKEEKVEKKRAKPAAVGEEKPKRLRLQK
jgi:hypothetical protein